MKKKLFIIDGNSLINRAFYALPMLADSNGVYSNAVFGFINCMIKLILEHKPDCIVVAFDHARKTFRNDIYEDYKGTRKKTPDELLMQFPILKDILASMNITCIEKAGIEADDIIGTIAKRSGCNNIIITGDKDSLQLIGENTEVWLTQKGISEIKKVTLGNIEELYGLTPSGVIDFKALAGDSSDNIPGVPGIGEKSALELVQNFGNIDNVYKNLDKVSNRIYSRLIEGRESCYMSKELATINQDCVIDFDVNKFVYDYPFSAKTRKYFEKYSFRILLKKDFLFVPEAFINENVEEISSNARLREVMSSFSGDYLCFDLRDTIQFANEGGAYKIKAETTLFDLDPVDFSFAKEEIKKLIQNDKIFKITNDLKANMHILGTSDIKNVFDINLAQYILSGGNKVEKKFDINQFYDIYENQKEELKTNGMEKLYFEIELPLVYVLYEMEMQGFKLDSVALQELKKQYGSEVEDLESQIKSFSPNKDINIRSAKQLSEFLFDDLKLPDKGNKKHSTSVEVLTELAHIHPIIPLILRYRKIQKLYSTYIEPYFSIMDEKGIIKTIFNQTQTSTGRLSSSEPNLQNIPVRDEEGKNLRKIFVSRFDGGKIMSADYNQIELRLLANLSNDETLIADYNKGIDIHRLTASQIFNKPAEQIDEFERRTAKAVNFGIIYGISSFGLSKNIDVSVVEAQRYIDIYFKKYPTVKEYLNGLVLYAKQNGYVKTLYGRIRPVPEIASSNAMTRVFGERVAMNMPLQGTASDIIKMAMIRVYKRMQDAGLMSKLILQVHDELIVDVYPGEEENVKNILSSEMQGVFNGRVPLIVSVGIGNNWYECK